MFAPLYKVVHFFNKGKRRYIVNIPAFYQLALLTPGRLPAIACKRKLYCILVSADSLVPHHIKPTRVILKSRNTPRV